MALDSIFSYFISHDDGQDQRRLGYLSWFVLQYPHEEFRREEAIFYDFMAYCNKLSVPLKLKYFEVYLSTELKRFCAATNTKIDGTDNLSYEEPNAFETALVTIREVMFAEWKELEATDVKLEDFPVFVDKFRRERCDKRTEEIVSSVYDRMSLHKGDTLSYLREQISAIQEVYDEGALEEILTSEPEQSAMEPVVDTGIPAIDKDMVALCRTQLLDISAPPGAGKTRMAIGVFAHRALLAGKNVLYFTLEQSKTEIENMLVARHVYHMKQDIVSDKMISMNAVPPELKAEVEAARIDILESGKYGKFVCLEADLYVETFIDKIKTQDRVNGPFDVIIIDHMSLLQSETPKYGRAQDDYKTIAKGYRKFKQYVRKNRKSGISVNQFNREGIAASKADKEIDATMGAGGIEAYRSTDANITITYNDIMASRGERRVSLPKSRSSMGFGSIMLHVKLACCYFQQQTNRNKM